ncbi:252_t:CDS:2, partial [Funneliformis mosseae]
MKGWMNEMEKHHDDFIWKLVYEEAPSYVREFGVKNVRDSTQNLPCIKKKSEGWTKVVKIFGLRHNKKRLSPSQPNDLKLWHDRVLDRLEIEILKGNFSCGKSTTGSQYVALKQLKNSKNVGIEFVHQLESSFTIINSSKSPKLYGISQDPETNDYILVMQYANGGDLRQYLRDNFVEIDWIQKISMLLDVAKGLKDIHDHGCAHLGIHDGNILLNLSKSFLEDESESSQKYDILISDFGMCTPANEFSNSSSHQKREENENESQSILLDPSGPYANSPRYKRAPAPKVTDLNDLTRLEKNVFIDPYASMVGGPIRQCIYHQRWFPKDFLVRFIRAYDDETSSVWIVPDFMEEGGTKRPGKGHWIRCNAKTLRNVLKEGKYKMIDNHGYWRKDMHEHIWKILVEDSILRFDRIIDRLGTHRFPMKKENAFHPVIKAESCYECYNKPISGLNCKKSKKKSDDSYKPLRILPNHIGSIEKVSFISQKDDISDKFNDVNYVTRSIPFYYVKTIWGDKEIEKIKNYLNINQQNPMIGVQLVVEIDEKMACAPDSD